MKHLFTVLLLLTSFVHSFAQKQSLYAYRDKVFTVFLASNGIDDKVIAAIGAKSPAAIETQRTALLQSAITGLKKVEAIPSYEEDAALKFNCREVLIFYKQLAEQDLSQVRDFFIADSAFLAVKKEFEKKKVRKHTEAEILAYNTKVKEYTTLMIDYVKLQRSIESARKQVLHNWNTSVKLFMDSHQRS